MKSSVPQVRLNDRGVHEIICVIVSMNQAFPHQGTLLDERVYGVMESIVDNCVGGVALVNRIYLCVMSTWFLWWQKFMNTCMLSGRERGADSYFGVHMHTWSSSVK